MYIMLVKKMTKAAAAATDEANVCSMRAWCASVSCVAAAAVVVAAFLFDSALAHAVPKCMRFANDLRVFFSVVFRY